MSIKDPDAPLPRLWRWRRFGEVEVLIREGLKGSDCTCILDLDGGFPERPRLEVSPDAVRDPSILQEAFDKARGYFAEAGFYLPENVKEAE